MLLTAGNNISFVGNTINNTYSYTHPATHNITDISGLQTALNAKVDDSQVLTDVIANALFTDTVYSKPANEPIGYITGLQTALDNKIDDSQVLTNVPLNALFTDTVYTHPASHSIAEVTGLQTALTAKQDTLTAGTGITISNTTISAPNANQIILQVGGVTQTASTLNFVHNISNLAGGVLNISRLTQYDKIPLMDGGLSTLRDLESDISGTL